MQRYYSNDDVVDGYVLQKSPDGTTGNGNLYFKGDVLYSYGEHFPLAVRLGNYYICNGDWYSSSTAKHQAILFRMIPNRWRVEIPFSALQNLEGIGGIGDYDIEAIKEIFLLDHELDRYVKTGVKDKEGNEIERHVLGASLFVYRGKHYLSGMDETGTNDGLYFLTELVGVPLSVEEAYDSMKPQVVKDAEENGWRVQRQGEWFFIEMQPKMQEKIENMIKLGRIEVEKPFTLKPENEIRTGHHTVTEGFEYPNGMQYVRGVVRHIENEHRMIRLYDGVGVKSKDRNWFKAVENVQGMSWSAVGDVD